MKKFRFIILAVGAMAAAVAALCAGPISLSPAELVYGLWNLLRGIPSESIQEDLINYLLLPHIALSFFVGGGLALCGAVMQAVMRNPLADPYLLGVSPGAGLGAVMAIAFGIETCHGLSGIGICAFLGAGIASILILLFSAISGKKDSLTFILAGFALNTLCSASVNFIIQAMADPSRTRSVQFWMMGNIIVDDWKSIGSLALVMMAGLMFFMSQWRMLDLMLIGDNISITMGRNLAVYRKVYIAFTALLAGSSVYMTGMIGFVGLMVPHAVRLVLGASHKSLIPMSFFCGGCFLICADLAGRYIIPGMELPIGVTSAVCGAPFFLWMMLSGRYGRK
jgi:iron complex transport system permease protein|nr:iron ABC transporter permease [uncultured Dialister sp.]